MKIVRHITSMIATAVTLGIGLTASADACMATKVIQHFQSQPCSGAMYECEASCCGSTVRAIVYCDGSSSLGRIQSGGSNPNVWALPATISATAVAALDYTNTTPGAYLGDVGFDANGHTLSMYNLPEDFCTPARDIIAECKDVFENGPTGKRSLAVNPEHAKLEISLDRSGTVTLTPAEGTTIRHAVLVDTWGSLVWSGDISSITTIDLSHSPAGVYYLKAEDYTLPVVNVHW